MKIFKRQRGQTIVELALAAPVFLFIVLAVAYVIFFSIDYVNVNRAANDAARNAVVSGVDVNEKTISNLTLYSGKVTTSGTTTKTATATATIKDSIPKIFREVLPENFTLNQSMYNG